MQMKMKKIEKNLNCLLYLRDSKISFVYVALIKWPLGQGVTLQFPMTAQVDYSRPLTPLE